MKHYMYCTLAELHEQARIVLDTVEKKYLEDIDTYKGIALTATSSPKAVRTKIRNDVVAVLQPYFYSGVFFAYSVMCSEANNPPPLSTFGGSDEQTYYCEVSIRLSPYIDTLVTRTLGGKNRCVQKTQEVRGRVATIRRNAG